MWLTWPLELERSFKRSTTKPRGLSLRGKPTIPQLTIADRASHDFISDGLTKLHPSIPILSEEGRAIPFASRKQWNEYWLVGPLDGTKEFISRNGEFTVNIALMKDSEPVGGVVYAPALGLLYYALRGEGASKITAAGRPSRSMLSHRPSVASLLPRAGPAPPEELEFSYP